MGEFCVCDLYLKDMKGEKRLLGRNEKKEWMMGGWEREKKEGWKERQLDS